MGVSFRTPNDPNPSVWVNHAVTVDATPSAGPSGVGGMNCSIDHAAATSYPAGGLTVNGDGVHSVTCTAWNQAVDPQGQPNTGTASTSIRIDESPPSLSFQAQNPADPTALVVDTSDAESGVAGGSIEMAPAGTSDWTALPTSFDGSHLVAHFDDAGLSGAYSFRATSCDNVGNCASTTRQLSLPLREASDSQVSLTRIVNPLQRRIVREQVRVGWHWATVRRHHKLVRVKRGGRLKTINAVKYVERCTTKRVHTARHGWRVRRICRAPRVHVTKTLSVPYGHKVTLAGLYTTAVGEPLPGQSVRILAAPDNNSGAFSQLAVVTTGPNGGWSATLPPGPSRVIRAVTGGTATILPSSGQVTTIVPASVKLAARVAQAHTVGRNRAPRRPARGRIPAARGSARAAADRDRFLAHHVRYPRARERERTLLDLVHVRARGHEPGPGLLVPDRLAPHGQLPLRTGLQPADNRDRGRRPVVIVLAGAVANDTAAPSFAAPRSCAARPQTFAHGRSSPWGANSWAWRTRRWQEDSDLGDLGRRRT